MTKTVKIQKQGYRQAGVEKKAEASGLIQSTEAAEEEQKIYGGGRYTPHRIIWPATSEKGDAGHSKG